MMITLAAASLAQNGSVVWWRLPGGRQLPADVEVGHGRRSRLLHIFFGNFIDSVAR
jgi:hypothetical protein